MCRRGYSGGSAKCNDLHKRMKFMAVQMKHKEADMQDFAEYRRTGDVALRDSIISSYLYIAEIEAKRFSGKGVDYDDLFQVACLGLLYAAERFDPGKGVKFSTFAAPTVSGEIKRYFRDKGYFIKVPRRLYEIFYKADKIRLANTGTTAEFGEYQHTGASPRQVLPKQVPLDAENAEFGSKLHNWIGECDDAFLMVEDRDFIDKCMDALPEDEQLFIRQRYYDEKTQKQIAEVMGTSQMFVSRMESRVLRKIKDMYFD